MTFVEFSLKNSEFFKKTQEYLKKLKEFSKKNLRILIKLRVLEAMCLRLPPKNRAKEGPGLG